MRAALLMPVLLVLLSSPARAEELTGKVVGVADGDTLTVLRDKTPVKIRLQGVDCPEKAQPFGEQAKQLTSKLVFGKLVTVKAATRDKYGRMVAKIYLTTREGVDHHDDGTHAPVDVTRSLEEELLRAGLAWHYKQYDRSPRLARLEQEARAAKRGLWADPTPTPPWEWRHRKKDQGKPAPADQGKPARAASGPLHGNTRSKVFHRAGCKDYDCKHCTAVFKTADAAIKAGYRAHPGCASDGAQAQPWSQDRVCRDDADCVLLPVRNPCACSPCGRVHAQAANRKALETLRASWARLRCKAPICPACAPRVIGTRAVCSNGQCQAR